ncbi:hypothetical protein GMD36_13030 [Parasutterella excrementihominis]|uniref:hypothetical protein n=1 Tax=Parasutterella excrementihominis TaxID=487175 RepID=UPI0012BD1444|nr:hypothetical protein [Parasutterella excrementihominis]MTU19923.1 hypothetical protein [Parasutterella excrementihominis]
MTATDSILKMFTDVLEGKISVWDFSFSLGEWIVSEEGDKLIDENIDLFDYLHEDILEEMELLPNYKLETNRELLTKIYHKAKELSNDYST